MTDREMLNTFHKLKYVVKYGLSFFVALLMLHCLCLYQGCNVAIIHIIMVLFALVLGLLLSRLFNMCWVHRLSVMYICGVLMCVALRPFGVFGEHLQEHRLAAFIAGMAQCGLIIWWSWRKRRSH